MRIGPWAGRKYFLQKMSIRDLLIAYFTYYAIMIYLGLAAMTVALSVIWTDNPWRSVTTVGAVLVIYPLVWYLLHRFVLHGRYLYKSPMTAGVWKRIHYDHHQDPNDLSVLFGALYTTLPTIVLVIAPIGWAIGGAGGAMAGLATGLLTTCFYEFCHCIQHLPFKPRWAWLQRIKKLHVLHHFHSEKGNYGITNYAWDHVFGTFYAAAKAFPRSSTVNNLGYSGAEAERFPWVARLSAGGLLSNTADAH
jgi:sterol desaturase/sphingolipid hydroxylase (fatty acid hydroxylase superfamily)